MEITNNSDKDVIYQTEKEGGPTPNRPPGLMKYWEKKSDICNSVGCIGWIDKDHQGSKKPDIPSTGRHKVSFYDAHDDNTQPEPLCEPLVDLHPKSKVRFRNKDNSPGDYEAVFDGLHT